MSKISRGKKGEDRVKKTLSKIKEYHRLMNDISFVYGKNEMSHQIDHILIHPHGVFVIETKNYYGKIFLNRNGLFIKQYKDVTEIISNPIAQNKSHVRIIKSLLKNKYDVVSVVVFVKDNAPTELDENIINLKDLLLFIDSYPYECLLEKEDIDLIYKELKQLSTKVKKKEHIENIEYLKIAKKEKQEEIRYAIENRKCPRCEHEIAFKDNLGYCINKNCDFKFKL